MRSAQPGWSAEELQREAETRDVHVRSSLSIAITALVIGYAFYAVARPATYSPVLWHVTPPSLAVANLPSWLFGSAPSFLHTLAFAVLLAVAVGGDRRRRLLVCLAWGAFEITAEFAQLPAVGQWLEARAPIVAHMSIVHRLFSGTFAAPDVIAGLIGTALAMSCVLRSSEVTIHEDKKPFDSAYSGRGVRAYGGPL